MPTPEIIQTIIEHLNLLAAQGKYLQLLGEIIAFTSMPLAAAGMIAVLVIDTWAKSKNI